MQFNQGMESSGQVDILNNGLQRKNDIIAELEMKNKRMEKEMKELKRELAHSKATIETVSKIKQEMEMKINKMFKQVKESNDKISKLEIAMRERDGELNRLRKELEKQTASLQLLTNKV